ncbi:MAG TPA: winged helix-turn-helix domain-containing protein [Stellaceae bacterium]|jgi:molybdate transport system regulatory protein|nr:winged helix-turn-helix domain-containing protein [Stellaceae bacterium]
MANLSIRVDLSPTSAIGPGKIRLLELIDATGSISAAGRAMEMSYRRAWLLVDELNQLFREPVAVTAHGGRSGGGASLTPFGKRLIEGYRRMESDAEDAVADFLSMIDVAATPARRSRTPSARKAAR